MGKDTRQSGRLLLTAACALSGVVLAACSHGSAQPQVSPDDAANPGPASSADHGAEATGPVYYLEQTGTVDVSGGVNLELQAYKSALKMPCEGHVVKALTPGEEAQLGTVRVRYWQDGDDRAARWIQSYKLAQTITVNPPTCSFGVAEKSKLEIWEGNPKLSARHVKRAYVLDMIKRTGRTQLVPYTPSSDGLPRMRMAGLPPEILSQAGKSSFQGWPCLIMKNKIKHDVSCVWTGGTKYGFTPTAPEEFPKFRGTPTFWRKSENGGNSFTTNRFTFGKLPDAGVFKIPGDIRIMDEGGP